MFSCVHSFFVADCSNKICFRTSYGFMAGLIGLFLSSLCVIKVVRKSLSYRFHIRVSTVLAERRDRAVQEDRCKAWREGVCLGSRRTFSPPSMFPKVGTSNTRSAGQYFVCIVSFETSQFGKDSAQHYFLSFYRVYFSLFTFSVVFGVTLLGQLRVVGTVESWCINTVCTRVTAHQLM